MVDTVSSQGGISACEVTESLNRSMVFPVLEKSDFPRSCWTFEVTELLIVSMLVELEFDEPRLESTSSSSELLAVSSSPNCRNMPPLIGGAKLTHGRAIRPIRYLLINRRVCAVWYLQVHQHLSAKENQETPLRPTRSNPEFK